MTVSKKRTRDDGAAEGNGAREQAGDRAELAGAAYSTTDLLGDFQALASAVNRLIPHDRLSLATREPSSNTFVWRAVAGVHIPGRSIGEGLPCAPVDEILAGADGVLLSKDTSSGASIFDSLWDAGVSSAILIPIRRSGQLSGFLGICSKTAGAYSDQELGLAREVASLVSGPVLVEALRQELDREIVELNALAELGRLLVSGAERKEQLDHCAKIIKQLVNYDRFSISIFDADQNAVVTIHSTGPGIPPAGTAISIPENELRAFFEAGRAFMPSTEKMKSLGERVPGARHVLEAMDVKSLISVPLRWQDQLVGAMQVFSSEENRYSERDRLTMERIANQVSGALAVTRLTESLQEDVHERMVMADLSRILASTQDPRPVVDPFVEKLREVLEFDSLFVNTLDYSDGALVDWFNWGVDLPGTRPGNRQPLAGTLTERVASSRGVFRYCAVDEQDALENVPNAIVGIRAGMRSWLAAPMISDNRVVGTIQLRSILTNAYNARSEALLERVASQVAGAFANAIAHEHEAALATEREKNLKLDIEKQELQRLNEMRDRFLGMVSHELKTPLTSVYAFANILARNNTQNLSPRQLNHIRVIQRNSRRLDMMIGDLLDVSRIEQGTFSLVNRPFGTQVMLAEVMESLEPLLEEKAQVLEMAADLGEDTVDGDRNRISQVIANLVSNASKYSSERDTITVRASVSESRFTVAVEDQGIGIGELDLARVFEPFYRIDNDVTRKAPGTGIGLFVARMIVAQHGGEVEIRSELGRGTTVSFWVPKSPPGGEPEGSAG